MPRRTALAYSDSRLLAQAVKHADSSYNTGRTIYAMRTRYQKIFQVYVGLITLFLLYIGVDAMRRHDRWAMGDWVTNYAGGFVRRGLIGQVALELSRSPIHVSLYVTVYVLQMLCYATLFATLLYLVRGMTWSFWMVVLIYSPATLLFTVFDPTAAFRKEILFLALLGTIIIVLDTTTISDIWLSGVLAVTIPLLVLSHEGMLFYYPYIVCAIIISRQDLKRALLVSIPGILGGGAAFISTWKHPGTFSVVSAICSSLGEHDLSAEPCSGAIVYMTRGAALARQDVRTAISYWHLAIVMPFLMIMSLTPVIMGLRTLWMEKRLRFEWWTLVTCMCSSWVATIGLFIYGFDWNRWIYVHVLSTLMLLLVIEKRRQSIQTVRQQALFRTHTGYNYAAIITAIILSCTWQLSFYHHFPIPGETVAVYLRERLYQRPIHKRLDWTPIHGR